LNHWANPVGMPAVKNICGGYNDRTGITINGVARARPCPSAFTCHPSSRSLAFGGIAGREFSRRRGLDPYVSTAQINPLMYL